MAKITIEGWEEDLVVMDDVSEFIVYAIKKDGHLVLHINASIAVRCHLEKLLTVDNETRLYRTYLAPKLKDTDSDV